MIGVHRRSLRLVAAVATFGLLGAACGDPPSRSANQGQVEETTTTTVARGPDTTGAQLRNRLTGLFHEHVYLAAAATGATAGGRTDEATAASAALDGNSDALTENFTAIFNADTGTKFGDLWKKHVGYVMAYAQGSGQAVNDLAQYARDFGVFINSILPSLPADTVTDLVSTHEQTVRAVIDAQKAGNEAKAYNDLRTAGAHMVTVGAGLSGAIAKNDPIKIGGDPASKPADFLVTLSSALREHVFLLAAATGATLGGRADEFAGAKAALDANSEAVTTAIAGVYGADAGQSFGPLWRKHIDFLVDYANAVAGQQQAKADEAMDNLFQYTDEFGTFISTASPKLTKDSVVEMIKTHVFTLKDTIDAQAARDFAKAYTGERTAADHMSMMASNLATAIVAQFPDKF